MKAILLSLSILFAAQVFYLENLNAASLSQVALIANFLATNRPDLLAFEVVKIDITDHRSFVEASEFLEDRRTNRKAGGIYIIKNGKVWESSLAAPQSTGLASPVVANIEGTRPIAKCVFSFNGDHQDLIPADKTGSTS